jgi:hypothetical protein
MVMHIGDRLTIPRLFDIAQATVTDITVHHGRWGWVTHIFVRFDDGDTAAYRERDLLQHIASVENRENITRLKTDT